MNEAEIKLMIERIGYTEFYRYYQEKDKEIERLNNIINELEKYIEYSLNNPFADERCILNSEELHEI